MEKTSRRLLSEWRKLRRRREREKRARFIAEGERCVEQILQNGRVAVEALLVSEGSVWEPPTGVNGLYRVSDEDFLQISDTENPQGVAAVCRMPLQQSLEELIQTAGIVIATDGIQDPGNLGTMIRSGVWFGASGLLCGKGSVDPYHPKVVRSTAGATGMLPVITGDLAAFLQQMEQSGCRVLLLDSGEGAIMLSRMPKAEKTVVVVGNEAGGIHPSLRTPERQRIRIEGFDGAVESLNAAVALGIALYELSR